MHKNIKKYVDAKDFRQRDYNMTTKKLNKIFYILTPLIILVMASACVSVKIPMTAAPEKATDVSAKSPSAPFKSSSSANSDGMWVSSKTASTITYFTSCSPNEPALKTIRSTAFSSLEGVDVSKEENITINEREGLKSNIEGKLEGVPVKVQFIVFKKNSCSYHLSYVALKENFEKELDQFTNFVKNFRVQ